MCDGKTSCVVHGSEFGTILKLSLETWASRATTFTEAVNKGHLKGREHLSSVVQGLREPFMRDWMTLIGFDKDDVRNTKNFIALKCPDFRRFFVIMSMFHWYHSIGPG